MAVPLLLLMLASTSWESLQLPAFVDLPPAADLERFPSLEMCDNQLAFLATRRAWLDGERGLFAAPMYAPWFDAATEDVEDRRLPWALLYEARGWVAPEEGMGEGDERRHYPPESRSKMARRKLAELRELLGDRAYNAGLLPALIDRRFTRPAD
jgi:hypothetical protein